MRINLSNNKDKKTSEHNDKSYS